MRRRIIRSAKRTRRVRTLSPPSRPRSEREGVPSGGAAGTMKPTPISRVRRIRIRRGDVGRTPPTTAGAAGAELGRDADLRDARVVESPAVSPRAARDLRVLRREVDPPKGARARIRRPSQASELRRRAVPISRQFPSRTAALAGSGKTKGARRRAETPTDRAAGGKLAPHRPRIVQPRESLDSCGLEHEGARPERTDAVPRARSGTGRSSKRFFTSS